MIRIAILQFVLESQHTEWIKMVNFDVSEQIQKLIGYHSNVL